jgi:hypothetical protein
VLSGIREYVSEATIMRFCEHCIGQRFDRAQVLRTLRATRKDLRRRGRSTSADTALAAAIEAVRTLEIPHLEFLDEVGADEVLH